MDKIPKTTKARALRLIKRIIEHDSNHNIFDEYNIDGNGDRVDTWLSSDLINILKDCRELIKYVNWKKEAKYNGFVLKKEKDK